MTPFYKNIWKNYRQNVMSPRMRDHFRQQASEELTGENTWSRITSLCMQILRIANTLTILTLRKGVYRTSCSGFTFWSFALSWSYASMLRAKSCTRPNHLWSDESAQSNNSIEIDNQVTSQKKTANFHQHINKRDWHSTYKTEFYW